MTEMNTSNVDTDKDIASKLREQFLQQRTEQEMAIKAWAEPILSRQNRKGLEDFYAMLPSDLSLKGFCPELYNEVVDPDVYEQQYTNMQKVFEAANTIASKSIEEGKECMQRFEALKSSQS